MLNIFRRSDEIQEIKFELQRISVQFQRVEWILHDIQSELEKLKIAAPDKSLQDPPDLDALTR